MGSFEKFNSNLETRATRNGRGIDEQWLVENEANELFSSKKKGNSVDDVYQKIIDSELNKKELEEIKQIILNQKNNDDDILEQMERESNKNNSVANYQRIDTDSDDFDHFLDSLIDDYDNSSSRKR